MKVIVGLLVCTHRRAVVNLGWQASSASGHRRWVNKYMLVGVTPNAVADTEWKVSWASMVPATPSKSYTATPPRARWVPRIAGDGSAGTWGGN